MVLTYTIYTIYTIYLLLYRVKSQEFMCMSHIMIHISDDKLNI